MTPHRAFFSRVLFIFVLIVLVSLPISAPTFAQSGFSSPANVPIQELTPAALDAHDGYGWAVAIDGDTAMIAAYNDDYDAGNGIFVETGAVLVYTWNAATLVWEFQQKLFPADPIPTQASDDKDFGTAIALQGDTALIGAIDDADKGEHAGAVYVFTRTSGVWTQTQKLVASDGSPNDQFGLAIDLDGNRALIGAPNEIPKTIQAPEIGAVYVFERTGETWTETAKLVGPDGTYKAYGFGGSLELRGNTAYIGAVADGTNILTAYGAVYIYEYNGAVWSAPTRLSACDFWTCKLLDLFGASIELYDETTLLIGAPGVDWNNVTDAGAAYIYEFVEGAWVGVDDFSAAAPIESGSFGASMSLDGDLLLVGAPRETGFGSSNPGPGSAYVFIASENTTWTQADELRVNAAGIDYFGFGVAINGNRVIVGAHGDDRLAENAGAAFAFYANSVQLVENGTFEQKTGKLPNGWTAAVTPKSRVKCDTDAVTIAHRGACAFLFVGKAGQSSIMSQKTTRPIQAGDTIRLSAYIKTKNSQGGAALQIVLKYKGQPNQKIKLKAPVGTTGGYEFITKVDTATAEPTSVTVRVSYIGTAGKYWLDDVGVLWLPTLAASQTHWLPLPLPPAP